MQPEQPPPQQAQKPGDLNNLVGTILGLGRFRIVERIGVGGMAAVFKAYQPTLDRYVAIKVLPTYNARDPVFVKRFVQEAQAVAKLEHPHIVPIYDFGEQNNITFIAMQYVDGGTLKDRLKQPLTAGEAVDFVIQAADGLACAHQHGVVHRDVKPANMLLRKDGYVLLSDFGIAKILEQTSQLTRVGAGIGTPQYMSPEQGTGQPVDGRSDIYSLGIVLFHFLAGRVPFTADNALSITLKHLNDPLPLELLRAANVPQAIERVVVKMTAKAAQDRYQSTEEVIDALTAAVAATHLVMPPRWRPAISAALIQSHQPDARSTHEALVPGTPGAPATLPQPPVAAQAPKVGDQPVTLACFRCGSTNPSTRLFCTSCGYELADKGAAADHLRGPTGRPILARFTFQNGFLAGRSYLFHQNVTTIGRTNGNDLVISERTVSRQHARLWCDNGRWYVEDLQSVNGTLVNGVHLHQKVTLKDGDVINFGDEVVVFNTVS